MPWNKRRVRSLLRKCLARQCSASAVSLSQMSHGNTGTFFRRIAALRGDKASIEICYKKAQQSQLSEFPLPRDFDRYTKKNKLDAIDRKTRHDIEKLNAEKDLLFWKLLRRLSCTSFDDVIYITSAMNHFPCQSDRSYYVTKYCHRKNWSKAIETTIKQLQLDETFCDQFFRRRAFSCIRKIENETGAADH